MSFFDRHIRSKLLQALMDNPVVLLHGPRQSGKSTLAQQLLPDYAYLTFDDPAVLASARQDAVGFCDSLPERSVLDEIQRVPELLLALKRDVDLQRRHGRFLLTGSANLRLLPQVADSLAGRLAVVPLAPLAQAEIAGKEPTLLPGLLTGVMPKFHGARLANDLIEIMVRGGYPPAVAYRREAQRRNWYRSYTRAVVERDMRDWVRTATADKTPRMLKYAAQTTAQLLNVTAIASALQYSRTVAYEQLEWLKRLFLVEELAPWHRSRVKRLVKTPKLHVTDTGLGLAVAGLAGERLTQQRDIAGAWLESFVYNEVVKQTSWLDQELELYHFRDRDGYEVDIVLEGAHGIVGLEVKLGATVTAADFRGLARLRTVSKGDLRTGIVFYDGENTLPFGEGFYAVPLRALWEQ